ncbi:MAG: ribonuclease H-like domain-containing protein [Nitrospirae bacterium]|nr:ribonuclease H-like domain-containing protein [Nitrospirota bacterium]
MIRNTFSMLNGIGEKLERRIWQSGILTWKDFCECNEIEGISADRKHAYDDQLLKASEALGSRNAEYFAAMMKRREHWRLYELFKEEIVCLDIETNGYQHNSGGYVTVVGLYDGHECKTFVRGENLTTENLNRALYGYKCLITFYGSGFDVPFLQRSFPGVLFDIPHFDLCYAARRLKIEGGLKKLEVMFGIDRDENTRGMNGYDAVRLWEEVKRGNLAAKELLLKYNKEDTMNLFRLAEILYEKLKDSTGIKTFTRSEKVYGYR